MISNRKIAVVLLWVLMAPAIGQARLTRVLPPQPASPQPVIEVFTDAEHPVVMAPGMRSRVTVYRVDALEDLKEQLAAGLPTHDTQAALREAQHRLQRIAGSQRRALQATGTGLAKAVQYGIDRYPAIVFDQGRAVVYGLTHVDEALGMYRP